MTDKKAFECIKDYFKEPLEEVSKWLEQKLYKLKQETKNNE